MKCTLIISSWWFIWVDAHSNGCHLSFAECLIAFSLYILNFLFLATNCIMNIAVWWNELHLSTTQCLLSTPRGYTFTAYNNEKKLLLAETTRNRCYIIFFSIFIAVPLELNIGWRGTCVSKESSEMFIKLPSQ